MWGLIPGRGGVGAYPRERRCGTLSQGEEVWGPIPGRGGVGPYPRERGGVGPIPAGYDPSHIFLAHP